MLFRSFSVLSHAGFEAMHGGREDSVDPRHGPTPFHQVANGVLEQAAKLKRQSRHLWC